MENLRDEDGGRCKGGMSRGLCEARVCRSKLSHQLRFAVPTLRLPLFSTCYFLINSTISATCLAVEEDVGEDEEAGEEGLAQVFLRWASLLQTSSPCLARPLLCIQCVIYTLLIFDGSLCCMFSL